MADQIFGVSCGFFDAVNSDRVYSAEDMNKPYSRIVADGVFATKAGTPSSDLQTVASGVGMNITVLAGQGIFAGKWFENASSIPISVPANTDLYTRIDSVIVQIDSRVSGRTGNIVYRTGSAAASPVPPAINTVSNVREWRIANITVAAGAVSITNSVITDLRGSESCPWVTSLIQQVDTSTLWNQFNAAYAAQFAQYTEDYESYVAAQRQAWEDFISSLTQDLNVTTSVYTIRQKNVLVAEMTYHVQIQSQAYDPASDILQVFINGLLADPSMYTVNAAGTRISLATGLPAGNTVEFVIYKSLVTGNLESVSSLIMRLNNKLDDFMKDSGWIGLNTENAIAVESPVARMIGSRVYLVGSVKNVSGTILTLPVEFRPENDHVFTSSAVKAGAEVAAVIKVASSGVVSLIAADGALDPDAEISLSTTFLSGTISAEAAVYKYVGNVNSYSDLPAPANVGDVYMILSADAEHYISAGDSVMWNGAGWQVFQSVISSAEIDEIISSVEG